MRIESRTSINNFIKYGFHGVWLLADEKDGPSENVSIHKFNCLIKGTGFRLCDRNYWNHGCHTSKGFPHVYSHFFDIFRMLQWNCVYDSSQDMLGLFSKEKRHDFRNNNLRLWIGQLYILIPLNNVGESKKQ